MKIGLTFTEARYENYPLWLVGNDADVKIVELHWDKMNTDELWETIEDCDGIVLSGGIDMHPQFYNNERLKFPNGDGNFNEQRDEFEMHVFETALNCGLPILAICRGMQLVNVALGGTLIQDLEEAGKKNHRRMNDLDDSHEINITPESLLQKISGSKLGLVNGAHHQAIENISDELVATATSPDGVVECLEWRDKNSNSWLLAVQWHPERMADRAVNPLSKNIREEFMEQAAKTNMAT